MEDFVRARTEDQFAKRREMILNACSEIYSRYGIMEVTFNTVSSKTSFTRPALYNYYKNREEMILDLMMRESHQWEADLKEAFSGEGPLTKEQYCRSIAQVASKHELLLDIVKDLDLIEPHCEWEKVAESRKLAREIFEYMNGNILRVFPDAPQEVLSEFQEGHMLISFGACQYTKVRNNRIANKYGDSREGKPISLENMIYFSLMALMELVENRL